jgi:hypothetical protein
MTQPQPQGFDIDKYPDYADRGLVQISQVGDSGMFILSARRFDPETGEELPKAIIELKRADLAQQSERLLQSAKNLQLLVADIDRLVKE